MLGSARGGFSEGGFEREELASVQFVQAFLDFSLPARGSFLIGFFPSKEEAQTFPHDLAGRQVEAALGPFGDPTFELWG